MGSAKVNAPEDVASPDIPLIFVSHRLYFTYFSGPAPASTLNRGNGTASAWFEAPKQQRSNATTSEGVPSNFHWFNVDEDLVYLSFFEDWGPLNVALFYRFCMHVHQLLHDEALSHQALVFYTSSHPHRKANASLLAALYSMIIDRIEPADAFYPFSQIEFKPFRDAGYGRADYCLTIQDILYGVHRAIREELLDLSEFNLEEYEYYEQVQCGDWNWITPNFLAFASPNDREYVVALKAAGGKPIRDGFRLGRKLSPVFTNTIKYFKERNIKLVVRLNNPLYDKSVFEEVGIAHVDLYFDDGSNPSEAILREFIRRADEVVSKGGAVAVHCKAGLGRTGVLIGAYLVWRYGFGASEAIGFMRIMRPGCVVGPQQHFMYQNFIEWVRWSVQDHAMTSAQRTIEAEGRKGQSTPAHAQKKRPQKRPSSSDLEDEHEIENAVVAPPVTPKAKKLPQIVPTTAAFIMKPVPCVGQPRKSPSPSRKRPAVAVPPAAPAQTAAQAVRPSRDVLKTSSSINVNETPHSISDEDLSSTSVKDVGDDHRHSRHLLSTANPTCASLTSLRNGWEALARRGSATPPTRNQSGENHTLSLSDGVTTPRSGRVLTEVQRLSNLTPSNEATPTFVRVKATTASTKAAGTEPPSTPSPSPSPSAVSTPSFAPRSGHHRSKSEGPAAQSLREWEEGDDVFGSSPQPTTPNSKGRVPSFKASPHVRAAYNLKDTKLPHPRAPRAELGVLNLPAEGGNSTDGDDFPVQARAQAPVRDFRNSVKGSVALSTKSMRKVSIQSPVAPTHSRTLGRTPSSSNSISPAKVRGTTLTSTARGVASTASKRLASGPGFRAAVRTVSNRSSNAAGSVFVTSASTTLLAKPAQTTSHPIQAVTTGSRPSTNRIPSQGSKIPTTSRPVSRIVGQSASIMTRTTPISNSANAAMLAARSELKRARANPEMPQPGLDSTITQTTSRSPLSTSAAGAASGAAASGFGRNVRRRRSSLGAADIGMA